MGIATGQTLTFGAVRHAVAGIDLRMVLRVGDIGLLRRGQHLSQPPTDVLQIGQRQIALRPCGLPVAALPTPRSTLSAPGRAFWNSASMWSAAEASHVMGTGVVGGGGRGAGGG
jgi:hypothetical protein